MVNWLQKAKLEISKSSSCSTAETDKMNITSVLAVPVPNDLVILQDSFGSNGSIPVGNLQKTEPVIPMTANEHAMISLWLTSIGEDDSSIIDHVLNQCRSDLDARNYFIQMAGSAGKSGAHQDEQ